MDKDKVTYLLNALIHQRELTISNHLVFELFPSIRPDIKEMQARVELAIRNIAVAPLESNVGKNSIQLFEEWCKRHKIIQTYNFESDSYILRKASP